MVFILEIHSGLASSIQEESPNQNNARLGDVRCGFESSQTDKEIDPRFAISWLHSQNTQVAG